jgi:hypothetical protein
MGYAMNFWLFEWGQTDEAVKLGTHGKANPDDISQGFAPELANLVNFTLKN